jgi:Fic family protein
MEFISVRQFAEKYGISERTARNYCANGKIDGAFLTGKTWNIPADATLPERKTLRTKVSPLLSALREQMASKMKGGIYHRTQIDLTYNSNHIEGSRLTHEQTRYIFETNTIGVGEDSAINVNDIIETVNHFRCIDMVIDHAMDELTADFIKQLHLVLKTGTSDSRKEWFAVGDYKRLPNEVGGEETCPPEQVEEQMNVLLSDYHFSEHSFEDILDLHVRFERIHPVQDGNGRVGRLLMFKECLRTGVVPFIITDDLKMFYYRGLREWGRVNGYLTDTCLTAQDQYRAVLDYFRISY